LSHYQIFKKASIPAYTCKCHLLTDNQITVVCKEDNPGKCPDGQSLGQNFNPRLSKQEA
jgi:hypothetical protein